MFHLLASRMGVCLLFVATLGSTSVILAPDLHAAPAQNRTQLTGRSYVWPKWGHGFEVGGRAFGHFGEGASLNSPPGSVLIQASYHAWYQHIVEVHAGFGFGLTNTTLFYGLGGKLNLLEFVEDPSGNSIAQGLQRGLLSKILKNFMIFGSLDFVHFSFPDPDTSLAVTYEKTAWALIPGFGAQWYVHFPNNFARRFYIETSVGFSRISGNNYLFLNLSIGVEMK